MTDKEIVCSECILTIMVDRRGYFGTQKLLSVSFILISASLNSSSLGKSLESRF